MALFAYSLQGRAGARIKEGTKAKGDGGSSDTAQHCDVSQCCATGEIWMFYALAKNGT